MKLLAISMVGLLFLLSCAVEDSQKGQRNIEESQLLTDTTTIDASRNTEVGKDPASAREVSTSTKNEISIEFQDGSIARYLVKEQLANRTLPSDAIGATEKIEGIVVFDSDGVIKPGRSIIMVDLSSLDSDSSRRDRFLRANTLKTDEFPIAEVAVTKVYGLVWPLPTSGHVGFEIVTDVTIHGVTKEITWKVESEITNGNISGIAKTSFTFGTFRLDIPRVLIVLSVEDRIRLELDFNASILN